MRSPTHCRESYCAIALLAACFAAITACEPQRADSPQQPSGAPSQAAAHTLELETIRIPDTISISPAALSADAIRDLRTLVVVGDAESGPEAFTEARAVSLDATGDFYVLDLHSNEIRSFDRTGRFVRRIGRSGNGPGELANPRGMTLGGDTLYVLDRGLQRFSTVGLSLDDVPSTDMRLAMAERIEYAAGKISIQSKREARSTGIGGTQSTDTTLLQKFDLQGSPYGIPVRAAQKSIDIMNSRGAIPLSVPEATAVSADGRTFRVMGDSFDIVVYSDSGRPITRIISHVPRVETVTADMRDLEAAWERLAHSTTFLRSNFDWPRFQKALRDAPAAKHRPAIGEMIASPEGLLLAKRYDVSDRPYAIADLTATAAWLLLSASYEPLGHIILPTAMKVRAFRNCRIAGVLPDENDVQHVVIYSIAPKGPGGEISCS